MRPNEEQLKLVTQAEFARILGVTTWTIWSMRKRGDLPPAVRVGRMLRWRRETLQQWLEEREQTCDQIDPMLAERASKALRARGLKRVVELHEKRRGRPTKKEQVEQQA